MTADERDYIARSAITVVLRGRRVQRADHEDMLQDALVAVWQAERVHDPARVALESFCLTRAKWAVIDGLRTRNGQTRRERSTDPRVAVLYEHPSHLRLVDDAPGPEQTAVAKLELAELDARLDRLPERTADALRSCGTGVTAGEVAGKWGCCPSRVSQLRREGRALLAAS